MKRLHLKQSQRTSMRDWQHRIANWKLTRNEKYPIERHLMQLHEEVAEVGKELRNGRKVNEVYLGKHGKPEGFGIELAQVVRQALWIAEVCGLDLEALMEKDMAYQESRRVR